MPLDTDVKSTIISDFQNKDKDTGSPEVQVALLTQRISDLTIHLNEHKHDYTSRRGLKKIVGQRRRLLKYIAKRDPSRYVALCDRLQLKR